MLAEHMQLVDPRKLKLASLEVIGDPWLNLKTTASSYAPLCTVCAQLHFCKVKRVSKLLAIFQIYLHFSTPRYNACYIITSVRL